MRILDAEPQLVKELLDEIEIAASKEKRSLTAHAGRHPTLGKVVIIESKKGDSLIVEVDE